MSRMQRTPGIARPSDVVKARSSLFRDTLQVRPEQIAALDDVALNDLMRELLYAQAYRCGAALSEIRVNTEPKASDDGADGWSPKPALSDPWLGAVETCWQFKAGSAGEPAQLKSKTARRKGVSTQREGEVTKRIPRETLLGGGRFLVVASGSTSGLKGEEERLSALREEAESLGLPTQNIDVFGSERLAEWCNQHPALAARWAGREGGEFCRLPEWLQSHEHQGPWQAMPAIEEQFARFRRELDVAQGDVWHLHIQGSPGVGKTRFALELCREADWCSAVVYVRQAADLRLAELIDGATAATVADENVRLVVVVDEAQEAAQLRWLREAIGRGQGRVRLITIGHGPPPNPKDISLWRVEPLEREPMEAVISGWYPNLPAEHVDFVVRFADGYVRLAQLAADAVMQNPATSIRGLLDLAHIRGFFDAMLGPRESRHYLYVVAVLTSVGWTEERQAEGQAVAQHLGLDWNIVRVHVESFHARLKIAPSAGRFRHLSPAPLANYLAAEAWETYPDLLTTLPDALPTQGARDAYYDRLRLIASDAHVRQFARSALSSFRALGDFVDVRAVRRWSALSAADPALSAGNLRTVLFNVTSDVRGQVVGLARREMVSALVRLAWQPAVFHNAVAALALLAEAESEPWADNNATVEFVRKFQVRLGGTAAPYEDRLAVLDELLNAGRPSMARLVVLALTRSISPYERRFGGEPASDELPEPEWSPRTKQALLNCLTLAIGRLSSLAKGEQKGLRDELTKAALALSWGLRRDETRQLVVTYFESVRSSYPEMRETLRSEIEAEIRRGRARRNPLSERELAVLEAVHRKFEDPSLLARLRQFVGRASSPAERQVALTDLASELLADREALAMAWPWLTSGEAEGGERLGEILAALDAEGNLGSTLSALGGRGGDLRVLCAYVRKCCERWGVSWGDRWLERELVRHPGDVHLLFEVMGRCGATVQTAFRAAAVLREREVGAQLVEQLGHGCGVETLPVEPLAELLRALVERGHRATAIAVLDHRWKLKPDEIEPWQGLALDLVTSVDLIRGDVLASFHWKQVADRLVDGHARPIAAAIFRAQVEVASGIWFVEHTDAGATLYRCADADPAGVWIEFAPYLVMPEAALRLSLPRWLLERLPADIIKAWTLEDPKGRAVLIAQVVSKNLESADDDDESRERGSYQPFSTLSRSLSSDDTVASWLLSEFADDERVAKEFWESCVSGAWDGAWSAHLMSRAVELEGVAKRTSFPRLRRWAENSALSLRQMAERLQQREAEEVVRWR